MTDRPQEPFKRCPSCGHAWASRETFLADPQLEVVGYQAFVEDSVLGLFLFNHQPCQTTLALKADAFASLHDGPIYTERLEGQACCPGYCLSTDDLRPCPLRCECAYVREILQRVRRWPKRPS